MYFPFTYSSNASLLLRRIPLVRSTHHQFRRIPRASRTTNTTCDLRGERSYSLSTGAILDLACHYIKWMCKLVTAGLGACLRVCKYLVSGPGIKAEFQELPARCSTSHRQLSTGPMKLRTVSCRPLNSTAHGLRRTVLDDQPYDEVGDEVELGDELAQFQAY